MPIASFGNDSRENNSARKDRLRMLMFSSFEVVYKVSALRSEFQENWRKILLPEALSCISHSFGIFSFVSVGRELQAYRSMQDKRANAEWQMIRVLIWALSIVVPIIQSTRNSTHNSAE